MRRAGWWLLCAALCAAAASAQPVIVDPTPDPEDETDWDLAIEAVDLGGASLATPTALVALGTRVSEELLVLEKQTGRVRHFELGTELTVALDLGVDTCGERGLIDIALHPFFDRGAPEVTPPDPEDPDAVKRDWVYLSYHTDADNGAGDDGCDGGALFRVTRYTWNGTQLVDPVPVFEKALAADETTELGGAITFGLAVEPDAEFILAGRLLIAIGALGHDGPLQNNRESAAPLDDTSVILRLTDTGGTPGDNPFDLPDTADGPKERYLAYGFRDPHGIAIDPPTQIFDTRVWATEDSPAGNDEIELLLFGKNSGYTPYQGFVEDPEEPVDRDGVENPDYPLVDLAETELDGETVPDSTYANPPFTFEDAAVGPTGLAFGGTEMGVLHRGSLFVGTEDGRLMRFRIDERNQRFSFLLSGTLSDRVADIDVVDPDPEPPNDPVDDDLTQLIIATGFGSVSDVETAIDGSLFVVDEENGAIYRVFSDARRDLAAESIKVPKKVGLSDKKPTVTKAIQVTLLNRGGVAERILAERSDDETTPDVNEAVEDLRETLADLLGVEITSSSGCAIPATRVVVPKYALPPNSPAIGIGANGGRLTLDVEVDWTCAAPSPQGEPDFQTSATVDMTAIGIRERDGDLANNVCPRPPDPDPDPSVEDEDPDPGCGAKTDTGLGGPIVTDITRK